MNDIGNYANHAKIWDWGGYDNTQEYEHWLNYATMYGRNVLIPMCALGEAGAYMAQRGFEVTAFDLTSEMIEEGSKRFSHIGNLQLLEGDIRSFCFDIPPADFSYVKDFGHLHSLEDIAAALVSINCHMRIGGGLVIEAGMPSKESGYFPQQTFHPLKQVYPNKKVWKIGDTRIEADTGRTYISQTVYIEDADGSQEKFVHSFYLQNYSRDDWVRVLIQCGFEIKHEYRNRDKEPWVQDDGLWIVEAVKCKEV